MLQPVIAYVMEVLPEPSRDTARSELAIEDLEKLPPEDTAQIVEWLTEKVDALSTKLKAYPKDEEEVCSYQRSPSPIYSQALELNILHSRPWMYLTQ
jgi:hypothetical protein